MNEDQGDSLCYKMAMERSRIDITDVPPEPTKDKREGDRKDAPPKNAEKQAVALTYKPENPDAAPVVSASGKGYLAEKIIELAAGEGIPIREDSDLVELLAATEIGDEIPVEAFIAVAEILRYVYEQNGAGPPKFD